MRSEKEIRKKVGELIERLLTLPNDCDDYVFDTPKFYLTALSWALEEVDELTVPPSYREEQTQLKQKEMEK